MGNRALLRRVDIIRSALTKQEGFHVPHQELTRLWIHHIQPVMINQHRLLLEPVCPTVPAGAFENPRTDRARKWCPVEGLLLFAATRTREQCHARNLDTLTTPSYGNGSAGTWRALRLSSAMVNPVTRASHRTPEGRFRNPWPGPPEHGFGSVLRWMIDRARHGKHGFASRVRAQTLCEPELLHPRASIGECRVTWIGHSTFLLQMGGLNILTDPMWGDRASPVPFAGPRRLMPPGVALNALPPIDVVLQSHDHYDHFDIGTVRELANRFPQAVWCVPLGVGALTRTHGATAVIECDWYESAAVGAARVSCVPARHFSGRSLTGRNHTLWCGWVITVGGFRIYFAGDTALHPDFTSIAEQFGPFHAVLLPIGAYDPRWFMRPVHLDPEEAVDAYEAISTSQPLSPPVMVAMHWGTFALTDEPVDEPPVRLRARWSAGGHASELLWVLAPGETRALRTLP